MISLHIDPTGLIEEYDSPKKLLKNKSSSLAQLVAEYTRRYVLHDDINLLAETHSMSHYLCSQIIYAYFVNCGADYCKVNYLNAILEPVCILIQISFSWK
ncbi:hypothetical protein CR513_28784, partial [Mucuna pruriens]